jgi:hypothetical protein
MSSGHTKLPTYGFEHKPAENKRFRKVSAISRRKRRTFKKVLIKFIKSPIFSILILFTPKSIQTMLYWLKSRLKEPSTYQGLTTVLAATGYTLNPEAWEAIVALAAGIIGFIQMIKEEKKLLEKK